MKTEDKIKGAADKRDKRRDQEFADAVIDILRETHKGDGYLSGSASSPEARLAAILAFLQAQAREVLGLSMRHPDLVPPNGDKARVAYDACEMLHDIVNDRRHPIHKFFRGASSRTGSTDLSSRKFLLECHLIACVEVMLNTSAGKGKKRPWAIGLMTKHPGIKPYIQSEAAFGMTLSRKAADENGVYPDWEVERKVQHVRQHLERQKCDDHFRIMDWTANFIAQRELPIDFAAASAVEVRRIMVASLPPSEDLSRLKAPAEGADE